MFFLDNFKSSSITQSDMGLFPGSRTAHARVGEAISAATERNVHIEVPDARVSVVPRRDQLPPLPVQLETLHVAHVARDPPGPRDLALDKAAIPQQQRAGLRAGQHLSVRQLDEAGNVAQRNRAKFAELALQGRSVKAIELGRRQGLSVDFRVCLNKLILGD